MAKYIDKKNTFVEEGIKIGQDTVIYPFVVIEGNTVIGNNCVIGPGTYIRNGIVGDGCSIFSSHIFDSNVSNSVIVGPYAYIREGVNISDNVKIGTFVEVKKSDVDMGSKIPHLSYVGDSTIGSNVNIGGGSITANFDGMKKNKTVIRDNAFVGVNSSLIAPVTIGNNSVVGAGSNITDDVPDNSLGIARVRQENRVNYYKK